MFSMGNVLYSAFDEDGALLEFIQKTAANIYISVFTKEIYRERYGKHHTCMEGGEQNRDDIYETDVQKWLTQMLAEIHEQNH